MMKAKGLLGFVGPRLFGCWGLEFRGVGFGGCLEA